MGMNQCKLSCFVKGSTDTTAPRSLTQVGMIQRAAHLKPTTMLSSRWSQNLKPVNHTESRSGENQRISNEGRSFRDTVVTC